MSHQIQNFEIHAGDDQAVMVTVKDEAGSVVDISGATEITWILKRSEGSSTDTLTKSKTGGGITITDGPGGVFEITVTSSDTAALQGLYYHKAVVTLASGKTTVLTGVVSVIAAGGLVVDNNSWISIEEADVFHGLRNGVTWMQASVLDKEWALIEAAAYLQATYRWVGDKASQAQTMDWPRVNAVDGDGFAITSDVVPQKVKDAQALLALEALADDLLPAEARGGAVKLKRERVDVIEEETEYFGGAPGGRAYPLVNRLLTGLIVGRAGGASFTVRRT